MILKVRLINLLAGLSESTSKPSLQDALHLPSYVPLALFLVFNNAVDFWIGVTQAFESLRKDGLHLICLGPAEV